MEPKVELGEMNEKIKVLKKTAMELKALAEAFPALNRNASRIAASIKMLEINVSDLLDTEV